jgi:threonine aldolase
VERGCRVAGVSGMIGRMADEHEDAQQQRERRMRLWQGAQRTLASTPHRTTLRQQLDRLTAGAGRVHDLDELTDLYGNGVVAALEQRVAELLGMEAAAFFPTGTMAQQVALRCWAARTGNTTVAMHPLAHPLQWEGDALSRASGLSTVHSTGEPRNPTAEEIRALPEPFGTLTLELPLREPGFVLPSWDELTDVVAAARERDAVVHVDGARLWECTPHFGRPLTEIAGLADSVYVSFYKSLGGISGAALAGPQPLVDEARTWRHRYGGQLFQQWPTALSALAGLTDELPRLPEYVAHAGVVAQALREAFEAAGCGWFRVHPEPPHTHQFQVWLPYPAETLTEAGARQTEETGVCLFRLWDEPGTPPGISVTEVTVAAEGLSWTPSDVKSAVADFLTRLPA